MSLEAKPQITRDVFSGQTKVMAKKHNFGKKSDFLPTLCLFGHNL